MFLVKRESAWGYERMAKRKTPKRNPTSGKFIKQSSIVSDDIFIPNHSGMLDAGTVHRVPTDEKDPVNKEYVDSMIKGAVDLFFTNNASDIATYLDMETDAVTAAEETIAQSITANSTTLIASFASQLDDPEVDAITALEQGIYSVHAHAESNFIRNMFMYFEFYKRTAGGIETLLGTSHDSGELTTSELGYNLHSSVIGELSFIPGDRIVCKVYGRNNNAVDKTITLHVEGDTLSRVAFPAFIPPTFVAPHVASHETGGDDAISHDSIDGVSANDHHAQAHTLASHSTKAHAELTDVTPDQHHTQIHTILSHDTDTTGAELTSLADNSMVDALHRHSELSASDGSPDKIVYTNTEGVLFADALGTGASSGLGLDVMYGANIGTHLIVGDNLNVGGKAGIGDVSTIVTLAQVSDATFPVLALHKSDSGNEVIGETIGELQFGGAMREAATSDYRSGAKITATVGTFWGINDQTKPSNLNFYTQDGTGTNSMLNPRMIINYLGDVDIIADFTAGTIQADDGFTGTGAYTNFTIVGGIITAAS